MAERRRIRSFEWSTAVIAAISFTAGLIVYWRDGLEKFTAILSNDLALFAGMLPKTKLGKQMYRKLKVYAGEKHPHVAQKPVSMSV